ncbi:tripartite tricarboxylate transporter substrate-binding protein [Micromonospora halotolerans]
MNEKGNGKLAMQMGLGVVGASYTSKSAATLTQTTPLAKMIEEAGAIVVPKDSPYKTINDLVAAWKANPKGVAVGGGSSPGGPDHLLPMQPAVLGGKVAFGASGFGEFLDQVEAGQIRVLAVTSEAPIEALKDVPTLKSAGIDLVFTNWRGIVAPPGISDADKKVWVDVLTKMHESEEWKAELKKRGWTDAFVTGDEFGTFLTEQDKAVADVLKQLGLA